MSTKFKCVLQVDIMGSDPTTQRLVNGPTLRKDMTLNFVPSIGLMFALTPSVPKKKRKRFDEVSHLAHPTAGRLFTVARVTYDVASDQFVVWADNHQERSPEGFAVIEELLTDFYGFYTFVPHRK